MNCSRSRLLTITVASALAGSVLLSAQGPLTLNASHEARALAPGEIVRLSVQTSQPVKTISGTAFGRPIQFVSDPAGTAWDGLVAIDVETDPGQYVVALTAATASGTGSKLSYPLQVHSKAFETRRLRVDPRFVDPPKEEIARIQAETALQAKVFAVLTPERLWTGPFVRPVEGASTGRYGELSVFNGEPRSRHRGTDFRAALGTPVRAPARGRVALGRDLYFSGGSVILDHGQGLFSHLAHLSRIDVEEGTIVEAGQVVGLAGATGRVTGPHLHWSARLGSASID
ncbi:MAG: M23 family metallopeptidase, partial [Vicinamibacterales bacterium]